MRAGAAVSTHPVAAIATGEATGQLLERDMGSPDLLCCFVTSAHAGALEDIVGALRSLLEPAVVLGAASQSVMANSTVVERGPGLALWAAQVGPVVPVRLSPRRSLDLPAAGGLILLGDPHFAAWPWAAGLAEASPQLEMAGSLVAVPRAAGGSLLALDGSMYRDGAVGVALGPGAGLHSLVTPGSRPIGFPMTVTRAAGAMIYELDGGPALQRLQHLARHQLPATDIAFINRGLALGVLPRRAQPGERSGVAVHSVAGADAGSGALALGVSPERGTLLDIDLEEGDVVQFYVRDAAAEAQELDDALSQPSLRAALVFASSARALLGREWDAPPMAGCQGVAALGTMGGLRGVHHRAAAVACF